MLPDAAAAASSAASAAAAQAAASVVEMGNCARQRARSTKHARLAHAPEIKGCIYWHASEHARTLAPSV